VVVGAILAGGLGTRMGGAKPARELRGRALAAYPAAVLGEVCTRVAIVAKVGSELPELEGVERWDEPDEPRHPAAGIAYALERAEERVLVCAADMPFVTVAACGALILAAPAVAVTGGRLQPLLGVYDPAAAPALRAAAEAGESLTRAVESLAPARVELPADVVRGIDTQDELRAEQ
jgi:molybdopterin-guanine dinucleotide biosynthesis protein A